MQLVKANDIHNLLTETTSRLSLSLSFSLSHYHPCALPCGLHEWIQSPVPFPLLVQDEEEEEGEADQTEAVRIYYSQYITL